MANEELLEFQRLLNLYRYDFCKLVYVIFPFGQPGHALEHQEPYDWQMEEWHWLSQRLQDPATRYETIRIIFSSGNGAAKTAWGAMTFLMLMYTQRTKARITANTDTQMRTIVWPEYDIWFQHARFHDVFFEKYGTSIKAKDPTLGESWRLDTVTWSEQSPQAISGLHNKGGCAMYIFEEAPGIPANIWQYASGAFTETGTIKVHLAMGNSDDPESKFEQNMASPLWHSRRIDTRTLKHIDPKQIEAWLIENGGDEDADDFRVRVRGLPRKTSKDSIIRLENIEAALSRRSGFDREAVKILPVVLTCDPAWQGGDETCLSYKQGNYVCLLEKYKLDKSTNQTHMFTYNRLCYWEKELGVDAVFIDQGEGTTIYTLAMNAGKTSWFLVAFNSSPNDMAESKDSEYGNIRAQMHYEFNKFLHQGGVLDSKDPAWIDDIRKQLTWSKGARHKITGKKMVESKVDIKARVGQSPDISDSLVLTLAMPVTERLPENDTSTFGDRFKIGEGAYKMPDHPNPYDSIDADFERLYD